MTSPPSSNHAAHSLPFVGSNDGSLTGIPPAKPEQVAIPGDVPLQFWNALFPFHLMLDRRMKIQRFGRSLGTLFPDLKTEPIRFDSLFKIETPQLVPSFERISLYAQRPVVIATQIAEIKLKGQFLRIPEMLVFVGSPCTECPDVLGQLGIEHTHFAPFDSSLENMLLRRQQKMQTLELQKAINQLQRSARERDRLGFVQQALAHDLNSSGDLLLRLSRAGRILEVRGSRESYFRTRPHELVGRNLRLEFPKLNEMFEAGKLEINAEQLTFAFECQLQGIDGTEFHFDARLATTLNNDYLLLARDVSERKSLEIRLQHRAAHDPQTDLPNRLLFERYVNQSIASGTAFSVLLIDLDDFKDINDTFGHQTGDAVIAETARRLKSAFPTRFWARLGGDEFGVLLNELDDAVIVEFANQVIAELGQRFEFGSRRVHASCSICYVKSTGVDMITYDSLLQAADLAMNESKSSSSQRPVPYHPSMTSEYIQRKTRLDEFHIAIEQKQIIPYYQPIIDLIHGRVAGFEALARWQHPQRGIVTPNHFIELAEETGLIVDVGQQIISRVIQQIGDLNEELQHDYFVNVNVSAVQIHESDIFEEIVSSIQSSDLSPSCFKVEITESILMNDFEKTVSTLEALRGQGINIALDDFGTGYSSLMYLERLPIDVLKLDRSFVRGIHDGSNKRQRLARTIIELGHGLNLKVVAEGIEELAEQRFVSEFDCEYGQGYLYSKPIPFDQVADFVNSFQLPGLTS